MRSLLLPLTIGLGGVALLVALGSWQLARLAWKEGILARIEAQLAAPPGPLPLAPDPAADRFRPVALAGRTTGEELHVLATAPGSGAAWRVVAGFETGDGRRLLLDRGLIPYDAKLSPRPPEALRVTGNVAWPDEADRFTPAPDRAGNIWFARDLGAMAAALGTEPLMVTVREIDSPVTRPLPLDAADIPNNHLNYAITWFGLALVWAAMTGIWIARRRSP